MKLLIPGPVSTQAAVRAAAAAQDFAPWDNDFRPIYADIRARVLTHCRNAGGHCSCHPAAAGLRALHAMEAAMRTFVPHRRPRADPRHRRLCRPRDLRLGREAGFDDRHPAGGRDGAWRTRPPSKRPHCWPTPAISHVIAGLQRNRQRHHPRRVGACRWRQAAGRAGRRVIVDAVSAFGALPLELSARCR